MEPHSTLIIKGRTSFDIFGINLIIQFVVSFTRKGWYLYLLVLTFYYMQCVAYLVYKGIKFLMDMATAFEGEPEEDTTKKGKKKKNKDENKPKVKYLKH